MSPFAIPAADGFELDATLFAGSGEKGVVIINSATAVPQNYYRAFAAFLVENGWTVITYDYRGIGRSRPASLRGFEARMRDWGLLDMQGALDWAADHYPGQPLFMVGHSVGGQMPGMLVGAERLAGLVTTSAQSGYWNMQGGWQKPLVAFHMHLVFPVLSSLMGYFPWRRLASGEDLPKGVALEWARWCRSPRYLFDDPSLPERERYATFTGPILAYSFDDDDWGTKASVDFLMGQYKNAPVERRHIKPASIGVQRIGHTRFYKPACRPLWEEVLAWFDTITAP